MISKTEPAVSKNLSASLMPLVRCFRTGAGAAGPVLLRRLAKPTLPSTPFTPAQPASVAIPVLYPPLRLVGMPASETLIGASLLRSLVSRHYSTKSRSDELDIGKKIEDETDKTDASRAVLKPTKSSESQPSPGKKVIAEVPWSHVLYEGKNQYVLEVVCGTFAQYCLCIPLAPDEVALAFAGPESLEKLAEKIRYSPHSYAPRNVGHNFE